MELRCHNCGQRLKLDGVTVANREVICVSCGAAMIVPPPPKVVHNVAESEYSPIKRAWRRLLHGERRQSEPEGMSRVMKRVYDPLPPWTFYVAGIVLALALLSPFWVYLIQQKYHPASILLSEDTTNITASATSTNTEPQTPLLTDTPGPPTPSLEQFHGLRLNENRDNVVHRFNLELQNTRGMEPEIYQGGKSENWEKVKTYFYGGLLKEFSMVCREQRVSAESVEKDLLEQCGDPLQRTDTENLRSTTRTLGLSSLPVGEEKDDITSRLTAFHYRRDLVWADSTNRVDATIYYSSKDPVLCTSMLSIHISAANWLKSRQQVGVTPPATTNTVIAPEPPKRLFP
jgi:hypothetical protein